MIQPPPLLLEKPVSRSPTIGTMRIGMIRHYWWHDFRADHRFIVWIGLIIIFYGLSIFIVRRSPDDWPETWFFFWSGLTMFTLILLLLTIEKLPGWGRYLCTVGILLISFFSVVPAIAIVTIFDRRVNAGVVTVVACDTVFLLGHLLFFLGVEIDLRCRRPVFSRRYRGRNRLRRMQRAVTPLVAVSAVATAIDLCLKVTQPDPELGPIDLTCSICRSEIEFTEGAKQGVTTPCGHRFHTDCLTQWFKTKINCPNCQQPIVFRL